MNLVRPAVQRASRSRTFFTMTHQPTRTCPDCKTELKPTEVIGTKLPDKPAVYFCGKCGARLAGEA